MVLFVFLVQSKVDKKLVQRTKPVKNPIFPTFWEQWPLLFILQDQVLFFLKSDD